LKKIIIWKRSDGVEGGVDGATTKQHKKIEDIIYFCGARKSERTCSSAPINLLA
jgi:hypothetical protein